MYKKLLHNPFRSCNGRWRYHIAFHFLSHESGDTALGCVFHLCRPSVHPFDADVASINVAGRSAVGGSRPVAADVDVELTRPADEDQEVPGD